MTWSLTFYAQDAQDPGLIRFYGDLRAACEDLSDALEEMLALEGEGAKVEKIVLAFHTGAT